MPSSSNPHARRNAGSTWQSRPDNSDPSKVNNSEVLVARRAFQIWDSNGRPEVVSEQVWTQAREELRRLQM